MNEPRSIDDPEFERIIEMAADGQLDSVDNHADNRQEKFMLHCAAGHQQDAEGIAMEIIEEEGYSLDAHGEEIEIDSESFSGSSQFRISRSGEWLMPYDVWLIHKNSDAEIEVSAEWFETKLRDELHRIRKSESPGAAAKDAWARSRGI